MGNRNWRLNNLYYIKDEKGKKVKFRLNWAQSAFWAVVWYFNVILKARQLGFSTFIVIYMLDAALFNSNHKCGIIDYALAEAKKKLEKAKFAYDNLPDWLKTERPMTKRGAEEIEFSNGSGIVVGTSHRGDTLQKLHVSEYGKIAARYPEKAKEIKTGALNAVHAGQQIFVESTAEGRQGEFYDLCEQARKIMAEGRHLTSLDPKFHFYAWFDHPGYELGAEDCGNTSITAEMQEYFAKVEAEASVTLSPGQKAWYVKKHAVMGEEMKREFPSTPDEAFEASLEGTYFAKQMEQVRNAKGIKPIAWEPSRPVHTFWDLAQNRDYMSVWFFQHIGDEYRFIRYIQAAGEDFGWFKNQMNSFGYVYGEHYFPHDGDHHQQTPQGIMTRRQIANTYGIAPIKIVARCKDKQASIDVAKTVLPRCKFCEVNAAQGIILLDSYRKKWNEKDGYWMDKPLHNEASHCADAFMTFSDGYQPRKQEFIDYAARPVVADFDYDEFKH